MRNRGTPSPNSMMYSRYNENAPFFPSLKWGGGVGLNFSSILSKIVAPWACKMNQIARCDWLHEQVRWSHLAHSGLPALSREKNFPESQMINPLLTMLFWSRWLDIGLVFFFFCEFMPADLPADRQTSLQVVWTVYRVSHLGLSPKSLEREWQFKMADEKQSEQRVLRVNQVDLDRIWQQSYSRNQNLIQLSLLISFFSWMQLSSMRKSSIFCDLN